MGKLTVRYAPRRGTAENKRNSGFTLVEMLLTTAILVILLGLSMVAVVRWRDPLKITELDNAAREIYMAAENRSVLLQGSGAAAARLSSSGSTTPVPVEGKTVDAVVLSNGDIGDLLPAGNIEPKLWKGHFYVLYDKGTHHVIEVFYAEEEFSLPNEEEYMEILRGNRSGRVSYYRENTQERCLVGYYGGGLVDRNEHEDLYLPKPGVEVMIENGNELTLTVKYTMPADLPAGVTVTREPIVTLEYGTEDPVNLLDSSFSSRLTKKDEKDITLGFMEAEYTWVLDSLVQDGSGNFTKQFKGLFSNPDSIAFGGDFTVTARLKLSADGYIGSGDGKNDFVTDTNNSLFDQGSSGETVYIKNLRHLQNLDSDSSGAGGKTAALQLNEIDASKVKGNKDEDGVLNSAYEFKPIANNDLQSYNGQNKTISNLKVTENSANGKEGAGLFGTVGKVDAEGFTFQHVRLVDSEVTGWDHPDPFTPGATTTTPTGALLGYSGYSVAFEDCQVVNTSVWGKHGRAGGLMGQMWADDEKKTVKFMKCAAEGLTVNSWDSYTGGLLGWIGGTGSAEFTNCTVGTNGNAFAVSGSNAGGLLGNAGCKAKFTDCTVGNGDVPRSVSITTGTYVGGLVGNLSQQSEIDNCKVVNIKVEGNTWNSEAGGLVGRTEGGAVLTDCTAENLNVRGYTNAGGILGGAIGIQMGFKTDDDMKDITAPCYANNVTVIADTGSVGGLVGNSKDGKFDSCTTTNANVSVSNGPTSEAGGLVGSATGDSFWSCSTTNATISKACFSGGLVGSSKKGGSFDGCTTTNVRIPSINGETTYVGGLVGFSIEGGTFTGCKVINAQMVPSGYATYAGGMVGSAAYPALQNCQVYWDQSGLTQISPGSYQVNGVTAGGLVGTISISGTITNSFAATLVKGTIYAGGLVGHIGPAATSLTVTGSYADCYIHNEGTENWATAGGLIGLKESANTELTLTNVYASGFISGKGYVAGGLCGGEVSVKTNATNAYAVMRYDGTYKSIFPLAAALTGWQDGKSNCYWLKYDGLEYIHYKDDDARSYAQMSALAFANTLGSAFTKPVETHPYWNTGVYPFPGLKGLPHYGDWPTS